MSFFHSLILNDYVWMNSKNLIRFDINTAYKASMEITGLSSKHTE